MNGRFPATNKSMDGFTLIELLFVLIILLVGLLGLAGLMVVSQQGEFESYQRAQAIELLDDMAARIRANPNAAACYAVTTDLTNGTPYLGTGSTLPSACSLGTVAAGPRGVADNDIIIWDKLLKGASEGSNAGAMLNARGCISVLDATTNRYMVTVVWEGRTSTVVPNSGLTCGKNLYPAEAQRRAISTTLRLADRTST